MTQSNAIDLTENIWAAYNESRDINLRNQITLDYAYLVKYIVYQLRGVYEQYAELDDMINQGTIALIESVEKFDYTRNTKFESFASIKIRGAIIDYVRKQDWVPKKRKRDAKQVGEATELLSNELGRIPTNEEIAQYLEITLESVEKAISEIYMFNLLSYEELVDVGVYGMKGFREGQPDHENEPGVSMEKAELGKIIAESLEELSVKENTVISLYYYENLKLKEIAYILGVSESRVCQMHTNALKKMKQKLQDYVYH